MARFKVGKLLKTPVPSSEVPRLGSHLEGDWYGAMFIADPVSNRHLVVSKEGGALYLRGSRDDTPGLPLDLPEGWNHPLDIEPGGRRALLALGDEFGVDRVGCLDVERNHFELIWKGERRRTWEVRAAFTARGYLLSRDDSLLHYDGSHSVRATMKWPRGALPHFWSVAPDARVAVCSMAGKLLALGWAEWDLAVIGRGTMAKEGSISTDGGKVWVSGSMHVNKPQWYWLENVNDLWAARFD